MNKPERKTDEEWSEWFEFKLTEENYEAYEEMMEERRAMIDENYYDEDR